MRRKGCILAIPTMFVTKFRKGISWIPFSVPSDVPGTGASGSHPSKRGWGWAKCVLDWELGLGSGWLRLRAGSESGG